MTAIVSTIIYSNLINTIKVIKTDKNLDFQQEIQQGIPENLPHKKEYPKGVNKAPKRKDILNTEEKKLAIRNA